MSILMFNLLVTLLAFTFSLAQGLKGNGKADDKAIVSGCGDSIRMSVLTKEIVRMEYKNFHDDKTFVFINRLLPVPSFIIKSNDGKTLEIETEALNVKYTCNSGTFKQGNLIVKLLKQISGNDVIWDGRTTYEGNLFGTIRTLDGDDGNIDLDCDNLYSKNSEKHCAYGVISRAGFVIFDDTRSPHFTVSGGEVNGKDANWPWVQLNNNNDKSDVKNNIVKSKSQQSVLTSRLLNGVTTMYDGARICDFKSVVSSEEECNALNCEWGVNAKGQNSCFYGAEAHQDLYFFGHGHDYKKGLKEFSLIAGDIPLIPRYSLGVWSSRYWAYSDSGQMEIVKKYQENNIPLDVLVTDMDWHITFYKESRKGAKDLAGETLGWTGFTWDSHLFPDPKGFLDWCKEHNIRNTLNLHPASGIQRWEETFTSVAEFMGLDPSTTPYVPFNATDVKYMDAWMHLVLKPLVDQGIDVWWLDWQQGEDYFHLGQINPTFWLNYIFFSDPGMWNTAKHEKNNDRPMILHRWGGLGNHRMQLGFSGDVTPSWESLNYEIYFTPTASNVLYGFWSHDIGGHTRPTEPELYTRWIQFGVLSPVFRTHCTKNAENTRDIWLYPAENFRVMRESLQFRGQINPYLYTLSRLAHETAISPLRPMYYNFPERNESYDFKYQYMFGDDLLASPIGEPVDLITGLANKDVFIPEGEWVGFSSHKQYTGPKIISVGYTLEETPLFARVGSIIPMKFESEAFDLGSSAFTPQGLILKSFVCSSSSGYGQIYDDDGSSIESSISEKGFAWTQFSYVKEGSTLEFTISAFEGEYKNMIESRFYQINLVGVYPASKVTVNGVDIKYKSFIYSKSLKTDVIKKDSYSYDGDSLTLVINLASLPTNKKVVVSVTSLDSTPVSNLCTVNLPYLSRRMFEIRDLLDMQWGKPMMPTQEDYSYLLTLAEAGKRISYNPLSIVNELQAFDFTFTNAVQQIASNVDTINGDIIKLVQAQLKNE